MLLKFAVSNHRCLRRPSTLSLTRPGLHTNIPPDGDWAGATTRVAGIYGPNASGKSTVLHALDFMTNAVLYSASLWAERKSFPHHPFALDKASRTAPSRYELDVSINGTRYTYGFESSSEGVQREWLHSYPSQRRRVLFERDSSAADEFYFGRSMAGPNKFASSLTEPHNLFLSVAGKTKHPTLLPVYEHVGRKMIYAAFTEFDQEDRMELVKNVLEDKVLLRKTEALLRFADLGISSIHLEDSELDSGYANMLRKVYSALSDNPSEEALAKSFEELKRKVFFKHYSAGDSDEFRLSLDEESAGTAAWLALAVPALLAIEHGDTFLVDEIDSSLHTKLCTALISIFKDPEINTTGAQLVFTSHDVSLLGSLGDNSLTPEEVWFTEKTNGMTELFSLHEFPTRSRDNFEKRYLEGRYGALPIIEIDELKSELVYASLAEE